MDRSSLKQNIKADYLQPLHTKTLQMKINVQTYIHWKQGWLPFAMKTTIYTWKSISFLSTYCCAISRSTFE